MNDLSHSYRRIISSTSISSLSSIINLLSAVIRTKFLALLLGPAGIGLFSIYQSFVSTASTFAGLGLSNSATREIAHLNVYFDNRPLVITIKTLFIGTIILAPLGAISILLLSDIIYTHIIINDIHSNSVIWLSIAVFFTVVSSSQIAILQGLRNIHDLAKLNIISSIIGTIASIAIVYYFSADGIGAFVVAIPFASVSIGIFYVFKSLRRFDINIHINISEYIKSLKSMTKLGLSLLCYALLEQLTFLLIRMNIASVLGTVELGYYHAGWTIGVIYLGILTSAMSNDFMPRIAEKTGDNITINRLINEQIEMGILIATPLIIILIGFARYIISFTYSNAFVSSIDLMRLILLSDILKLISWPIGIALIGMRDGVAFSRHGPVQLLLLLTGSYFLLPYFGISSIGITMMFTQVIGLIYGYRYISSLTGFKLSKTNNRLMSFSFIIIISTYFICIFDDSYGLFFSAFLSFSIGFFSYKLIKTNLLK